MFYRIRENQVFLNVKVQPGASKSEFCGMYGDEALKIRIRAAAVEGAANRELIRFLSKQFKVPKNEISFKSGKTAKTKVLVFPLTDEFQNYADSFCANLQEQHGSPSNIK